MVDINLEIISTYLHPDLGTVTLNPNLPVDETPPDPQPAPAVMVIPKLVPSSKYRWKYKDIRFLHLGYVLERNSSYKYGEIKLLSDQATTSEEDPNATFTLPTFTTSSTSLLNIGAVNCTLSILQDSLSDEPQFGIAFQITHALPNVYPTLRVFVMKLLTVT